MAYRLKSRQMQIPNGFRYVQPETGFMAGNYASFQNIVDNLVSHRRGRPDLVVKHGWSLDPEAVANEVEAFNVRLCLQHGWTDYLDGIEGGGGLPPKSRPPSQQEVEQVSAAAGRAKKIWAGVRTLNDWIDSGDAPVVTEHAAARAEVCAACPKNTQGDFTSWFTKPAAGAIKQQIEKLQERKLSTPSDDKINICEVCLCPLKLKVHTPLPYIKAHLTEAVVKDLQTAPGCWIVRELADAAK